ncbi:MAG: ABC transporter ATP-binding protein [Chloroflexi bacterium]|nr:ABC transporter ATP-binding protein [Chloroflexota bacterium]
MPESWDVELQGVTKYFGSVVAVEGLTLRIQSGQFYSLLGPSGCGKTTTLRMIAGFEHPSQGIIRIAGQDVLGIPPYRRNVNMVFQHYALFPHMSVEENVAYGLKQKKVSVPEIARRVQQALAMVQLTGLERRRPHELSGGQQQRVALARALINRPTVLLLDEPLGALDQKLRKAMQLELKSLQRTVGITFIYVTHDQEEALTMSDYIAVMNAGRLEQLGTAIEVYERPRTRFVADFIGLSNFFRGEVIRSEGGLVVAVDRRMHLALPPHSGARPGQRITVAVRPEKVRLAPVSSDAPSGLVGRVASSTYLGEQTEYRVGVNGLGTIIARRQNSEIDSATPRLAAGELVQLSWALESSLILPEEGVASHEREG